MKYDIDCVVNNADLRNETPMSADQILKFTGVRGAIGFWFSTDLRGAPRRLIHPDDVAARADLLVSGHPLDR